MYKFLAYEWPTDWDEIDTDHIVDIAVKTQCQMCILDARYDENGFSFWVFGFAYVSLQNLEIFVRESGFRKGRWTSITQEQFLRGFWAERLQASGDELSQHIKRQSHQFDFSEKGKVDTIQFFQMRKWEAFTYSTENREFHQSLKTAWKAWPVFQADWSLKSIYSMSRDEKDVVVRTWQNMYQDAQMLGSLLGFVTLPRTSRVRRLFLPLPFYELLPLYREQVAPHLSLLLWSLVERKDIPNTIQTHSWQRGLVNSLE